MFDMTMEADLCNELRGRVITNPSGMKFIKHHLVNTLYMGSRQENHIYNEQLKMKQAMYDEYIAAGDVGAALAIIERPWRCDFAYRLILLEEMVTPEKAAELVSWLWTDSENIWENKDAWHDLLMHIEPHRDIFMGEDNVKELQALPNRIKIYRGFDDLNGDDSGYSWTTDQETAWWFARRFAKEGCEDSEPTVRELTINKADVFAYLKDDRKESEIIYLDA